MINCSRCNKETDSHTDGICNECWDWAFEYIENTEE